MAQLSGGRSSDMGGQAVSAPPLSGNAPSVGGIWAVKVLDKSKLYQGLMELQQNGANIAGAGYDQVGKYNVKGWIQDGNTIVLQKRFLDPNQREAGPIITLSGKLDLFKIPMVASGTWKFTKSSGSQFGYYNKQHTDTFQGQWAAILRKSKTSSEPPVIASTPPPDTEHGKGGNFVNFMLHNGIWIALGVGVIAIGSSFVLFGPSGLINIWNKQQYIPRSV